MLEKHPQLQLQLRVEKKKVELIKIRSDMESKVGLLRVPRLMKTSEINSKGINYMLDSKHQIKLAKLRDEKLLREI